jgi:hypothetical protein
MSDILTFLQRPDGTIVPKTAISSTDQQTVTATGAVIATAAVPTVSLAMLSYLTVGQAIQSLFQGGGSVVSAGPVKVAQRFYLHLMTPKGSVPYRPSVGSQFVPRLQQRAASDSDVFAAFASAMLDVTAAMQNEEAAADPPDERFRSARMTQLVVANGHITAVVQVNTLAGVSANLSLNLDFLLAR